MRAYKILIGIIFLFWFANPSNSQSTGSNPLSLNGFSLWITGGDSATVQLLPRRGKNGLTMEGGKTVVHARFNVQKYGEVSTPISRLSAPNAEAKSVNLSGSRYVKIRYKANQTVVLQLRQAGVHGGTHNHVLLPPSRDFTSTTVYFSSFKGGNEPVNLREVAKFNFAFLENNQQDGFADLVIQSFTIDRYNP